MKQTFLFVAFVYLTLSSSAQVVGNNEGRGLDMQTGPHGFVTQLPMVPGETKGDVYLYPEWRTASIILFEKNLTIENYKVRLDLERNEIEIYDKGTIKALSVERVRSFTLDDPSMPVEYFVNGRAYTLGSTPLIGFLGVLDSVGNWELLSRTRLKPIQSTYVAALDAGDKNSKLIKETAHYFAQGKRLIQVTKNTKKFSQQFLNAAEVESFIKQNKIRMTDPADLRALLRFLESSSQTNQ